MRRDHGAVQRKSMTPVARLYIEPAILIAPLAAPWSIFCMVADGLDVVTVGADDECSVVIGVILGP